MIYYKTADNMLFDRKTQESVGVWNEEDKCIDACEEDDEEEEEEWIKE